jgi:quinol monooxygenase YgiN
MSQSIDHNKRHYVEDDIKTILNVRIFIEPDRVDEWIEKSQELFQTVMAEPACRYFITGQVEGKPGELWWTEGWSESKEWLMQVSCVASHYHDIAAGADVNMCS